VDVDRPALALDEQLDHEQRRDRGRRYHQSTSYRRYDSHREAKSSLRITRLLAASPPGNIPATLAHGARVYP
jgi:hypothetical protein